MSYTYEEQEKRMVDLGLQPGKEFVDPTTVVTPDQELTDEERAGTPQEAVALPVAVPTVPDAPEA